MAITGVKKEESGEYVKSYGLAAFEVLGVNLSNKELKELGFYVKDEELEKEREFVKEREGVDVVMIEFAARSVGSTPKLKRFSFFIENKNRVNKNGDLWQYINDQGQVAWSKKEKTYSPLNAEYAHYFTGTDDNLNPRPAKAGEEQFMDFMRNCMAINFKEGGTIVYNPKKFFAGNFKELAADLETDFLTTILVATTIKVKETEDGVKEIESFYQYAFAPGSYYKSVLTKKEFTDADVDKLRAIEADNKNLPKGTKKTWLNPLDKLILKMTDDEHGCKDIYHLGLIKNFTGAGHIETSDKAIISTEVDEPVEDDESKY